MLSLIPIWHFRKFQWLDAEIWAKKIKKCPQNGGFSSLVTPKIFLENPALSLLYPYGTPTSCKKSEKTNEGSLKYSKTNGRTHGPQGWLLRTLLGKPWVQKEDKISCI